MADRERRPRLLLVARVLIAVLPKGLQLEDGRRGTRINIKKLQRPFASASPRLTFQTAYHPGF